MTDQPQAAPTGYCVLGPADILHDLQQDFLEIGWQVTAVRWQAVITAPAEDAGHTPPEWPAEVTLAKITHTTHAESVAEFLQR